MSLQYCENCQRQIDLDEDTHEECGKENKLTPKEQLTKDRRQILSKMTVEKAEKYPELYTFLFSQADTMHRMNNVNAFYLKTE